MRCKDTLFHPFTNIFECLFLHRQQAHPVPTSTPGLTSVGRSDNETRNSLPKG